MNFGQGYQVMESAEMLDDGIYTAKIKTVKEGQGKFGNYLLVEVVIKDHAGANPNKFILNDSPKISSANYSQQELHEMWCKSMTKFFRNFQIQEGNFNTAQWIGKIGRVTVRPQKNNSQYKEIVPYEMKIKPEIEQNQNQTSGFGSAYPQNVQNVQNGFVSEVASGSQSQSLDNFPDEVPF